MKTQWPETLYHACILALYGSPTVLGMFTKETDAIARLEVARRQIVNDTDEPIWFYVLRVENGVVISRKDLSFENPPQEVYAM